MLRSASFDVEPSGRRHSPSSEPQQYFTLLEQLQSDGELQSDALVDNDGSDSDLLLLMFTCAVCFPMVLNPQLCGTPKWSVPAAALGAPERSKLGFCCVGAALKDSLFGILPKEIIDIVEEYGTCGVSRSFLCTPLPPALGRLRTQIRRCNDRLDMFLQVDQIPELVSLRNELNRLRVQATLTPPAPSLPASDSQAEQQSPTDSLLQADHHRLLSTRRSETSNIHTLTRLRMSALRRALHVIETGDDLFLLSTCPQRNLFGIGSNYNLSCQHPSTMDQFNSLWTREQTSYCLATVNAVSLTEFVIREARGDIRELAATSFKFPSMRPRRVKLVLPDPYLYHSRKAQPALTEFYTAYKRLRTPTPEDEPDAPESGWMRLVRWCCSGRVRNNHIKSTEMDSSHCVAHVRALDNRTPQFDEHVGAFVLEFAGLLLHE